MALRFIDSFDHYATADGASKYTATSQFTIDGANSRFGSGLRLGGNNATGSASITLDNQATWIMGFAFKSDTLSYSGQQSTVVCQLLDGASIQAELRFNSTTKCMDLYAGNALRVSGATVFSQNVWYYVEMKVIVHNTAGTASYKINGTQEGTYGAGAGDTSTSGNAYASIPKLGPSTSSQGGYFRYDDFYVCDGTGSTNNDYLGDIRVEALFPNGNGNSSVLVGSDANSTDNYLLVDESSPNSDTDYVQGSSVGDKDTYTMTNLTPGSGTVYGVMVSQYAKKTDASARSIASVARLSGTEVDSANSSLSTSYLYYKDIRETKPGGGSWSVSDVNSVEIGPKVTV